MNKILQDYGLTGGVTQSDLTQALKLADELGSLVDRYSCFQFFVVGDALGLELDRDPRTDAVYKMAWAGHASRAISGC